MQAVELATVSITTSSPSTRHARKHAPHYHCC